MSLIPRRIQIKGKLFLENGKVKSELKNKNTHSTTYQRPYEPKKKDQYYIIFL